MTTRWWHIVALLLIGYALGYYWPMLGKATLGKIGIAQGA